MTNFEFTLDGDESSRRAFRTQVPGLEAWIRERQQGYSVKDISAAGFALHITSGSFSQGETVHMDLLLSKRLYIGELPCQVVRVLEDGIVGFEFLPLDIKQEARLDKLVLEVQKRSIAKKRTGSEED